VGAALHEDLAEVYSDLSGSMRRAQAAAHGTEGTLRVGFLTHARDEAFVKLVALFAERHPACTVTTVDILLTRRDAGGPAVAFTRLAAEPGGQAALKPGYHDWWGPLTLDGSDPRG